MAHGKHGLMTFGTVNVPPCAVNVDDTRQVAGMKGVVVALRLYERNDLVSAELDHEVAKLDS
jgi:hypothetical protein